MSPAGYFDGALLFGTVDQLVLVGALVAGLDAPILPKDLCVIVEFLREREKGKENDFRCVRDGERKHN